CERGRACVEGGEIDMAAERHQQWARIINVGPGWSGPEIGARRVETGQPEIARSRCAACVQNGGVSSVQSSHSALSRARASALLLAPTTQAALIEPIDAPATTLSTILWPRAANWSISSSSAFNAPHS